MYHWQTFLCCDSVSGHISGFVYPINSIALVDRLRELNNEWIIRDNEDLRSKAWQYNYMNNYKDQWWYKQNIDTGLVIYNL